VTGVIAEAGISIRQTIVSDPDLSAEPRLYVITRLLCHPRSYRNRPAAE